MAVVSKKLAARCSYIGVADPRTKFHILRRHCTADGGHFHRSACNAHLRPDEDHEEYAEDVMDRRRCTKCKGWPERRTGMGKGE